MVPVLVTDREKSFAGDPFYIFHHDDSLVGLPQVLDVEPNPGDIDVDINLGGKSGVLHSSKQVMVTSFFISFLRESYHM